MHDKKKKKYSNMTLLDLQQYNREIKARFTQGANTKILASWKARDKRENAQNEYDRLLGETILLPNTGAEKLTNDAIDRRRANLKLLIDSSK